MRAFVPIVAWALLAAGPACALDFSEETDKGSSLFTQSVNGDGDFGGGKDRDAPWNWNFGYNYERSVTPNPGAADIVDNTNDWTGGFGWIGDSGWGADANLEYSNTPDENLVARGGSISVSYRWKYGNGPQGSAEDQENFTPYFDFKLNGGSTNYLESFGGEKRVKKILTPTSGTAELRQNLFGGNVGWRPFEDWKFKLGIDHYGYNRNVTQFENQLDSPAALLRGMSGFSNTVGGLARVTYSADVTWQFANEWKADLNEAYSILAADNSISTSTKATVEYKFAQNWRVTAGAEHVASEVLTDTLGILGFEWNLN